MRTITTHAASARNAQLTIAAFPEGTYEITDYDNVLCRLRFDSGEGQEVDGITDACLLAILLDRLGNKPGDVAKHVRAALDAAREQMRSE